MSFFVTLPPMPEPGISRMFRPCSAARRRTTFDERVMLAVVALACSLGLHAGKLLGRGFVRHVLSRQRFRWFFSVHRQECDLGPHVHRRTLGDEELFDLSGERRWKFGVDLVRVHFGEWLVQGDLVSLGLEPAG